MLSVTNTSFILCVLMLNADILSVVILNAVLLSIVMLNPFILSVVMRSVAGPSTSYTIAVKAGS
jgi:hypothetical protein